MSSLYQATNDPIEKDNRIWTKPPWLWGFKMLIFPNFPEQKGQLHPVASTFREENCCIQPLRSTQTGSASVWDLEVGRMGKFHRYFCWEEFFSVFFLPRLYDYDIWLNKNRGFSKKSMVFSIQPSELHSRSVGNLKLAERESTPPLFQKLQGYGLL